jgi:EpsI family protein
LDKKIVEALNLDDYLFATYQKDNHPVTIYIGYYNSPEKIGEAHDPLVCFPGQGWNLTERETGKIEVSAEGESKRITYSTMVAEKGVTKELLIYWFQVDDKTSSSTIGQKLNLLLSKVAKDSGENAFVRISSNASNHNIENTHTYLMDFVQAFYPYFHNYISNDDST